MNSNNFKSHAELCVDAAHGLTCFSEIEPLVHEHDGEYGWQEKQGAVEVYVFSDGSLLYVDLDKKTLRADNSEMGAVSNGWGVA